MFIERKNLFRTETELCDMLLYVDRKIVFLWLQLIYRFLVFFNNISFSFTDINCLGEQFFSNLRCHKEVHNKEKMSSCKVCWLVQFVSNNCIQTHVRNDRYSCEVWTSGILANLHLHMQSHTGDNPYSCQVSRSAFTNNLRSKKHAKTRW